MEQDFSQLLSGVPVQPSEQDWHFDLLNLYVKVLKTLFTGELNIESTGYASILFFPNTELVKLEKLRVLQALCG